MDMEELADEEEDESEIGGDLEMDEEERRMLEMAEFEDENELNEIENLDLKVANGESGLGKKRKKPVAIKLEDEPELEYEYEREDLSKPAKEAVAVKAGKKQKRKGTGLF
jgi:hypothetical protein